jgi:hypothetical protein
VDDLGRAWGLVVEPPQSYSVEGLRRMIEYEGPVWMSMAVPSGHAVVLRGIYGDGTPGGTFVRVLDPWPPGQGATYDLSIEQMAQRYEDLISVDAQGNVNTQVLHAGGRNGAQAQGYAARAMAAGARYARGMSGGVEIASAIIGATMTAVLHNPGGGLSLRLEQLHGKKYPADDPANEGSGTYQNEVVELSGWPSVSLSTVSEYLGDLVDAGTSYANLRIDFDYNGRTVGNVRIVDVDANNMEGGSLDVTATIMDDAQVYRNAQGEAMAAVKVTVRHRFTLLDKSGTAVVDLKLYGDGRHSRHNAWTEMLDRTVPQSVRVPAAVP